MNAIVTDSPPVDVPVAPVQAAPKSLRQTFVLNNPHGLHCRPAALLIRKLKDFDCSVLVAGNGAIANGRSIIGLLTLAAGYGTKLTVTLTGPDAKAAMSVIQLLFESNFTGAYTQSSTAGESCAKTKQKRIFQASILDPGKENGSLGPRASGCDPC
jgi:phosphocarrier protein